MKTIHSITLHNGLSGTYTESRTSESRVYTACVVCTVTERSVEIDVAAREAARIALGEQVALLADLKSRLGMDEDKAKVAHDAEVTRWFNEVDGVWTLPRAIRHNKEAERAEMVKRGFTYPWDLNGPHGLLEAAGAVGSCEWRIAQPALMIGLQHAVSWHSTADLAVKAAATCQNNDRRGDLFRVRTDVTRKTKEKRHV